MDYIAHMSNTEPEGNKLYYMYVRLSKGYIHCSNKLKKIHVLALFNYQIQDISSLFSIEEIISHYFCVFEPPFWPLLEL